MLSSHEKCPICDKEFKHAKYLNKDCQLIGKRISFVESVCNAINEEEVLYPKHTFFQITSLYGEMFFQKVHLPFLSIELEINYTTGYSDIVYLPKSDAHFITAPGPITNTGPERIHVKRIFDWDFPNLEKMINKAKVLAPFL